MILPQTTPYTNSRTNMNFITITTENYIKNTIRLIRSLKLHHPDSKITIFSNNISIKKFIEFDGCTVQQLPAINKIGVKRAKFQAYSIASRYDNFIYLDSDIIILDSLTDLVNAKGLTACRDNLQACSHFIENPSFPWTSEPNLSGKNYFNSGVFFAESSLHKTFKEIEEESLDDDEWKRFTIPNKLYDNHFLCAKLSQKNVSINFIPEKEYNWQGYHQSGNLECLVNEKHQLVNKDSLRKLKLVHFAGINNIDDHIASLPQDVAKVLAKNTPNPEIGLLEIINSTSVASSQIEPRLQAIIIKSLHKAEPPAHSNLGKEIPLLEPHSSILSITQSINESTFHWNNLKCGSAYLSAKEYQRLREIVRSNNIESVLEFGAGYTSVLFHRLGLKQIALEGWNGPWLDFAKNNGADARLTPFCTRSGFDIDHLQSSLIETTPTSGNRMIFIDSPPGTANRLLVTEQLIKLHQAGNLYAVHDSVRDSSIVYKLSQSLNLKVVDHLNSVRGLTILGSAAHETTRKSVSQIALHQRMKEFLFSVKVSKNSHSSNLRNDNLIQIELKNIGKESITAFSDEVMFSMHLADSSGNIYLWDTPRYSLPVDLDPDDSVSFEVEVPRGTRKESSVLLFDFVKEGQFWWSEISGSICPKGCI